MESSRLTYTMDQVTCKMCQSSPNLPILCGGQRRQSFLLPRGMIRQFDTTTGHSWRHRRLQLWRYALTAYFGLEDVPAGIYR